MSNLSDSKNKGRVDRAYYANMPLEHQQAWSRQIIERIMSAYKFNEKKVLAEHLNCHQNMPSNWIQTASVPWTVVHLCHEQTGASLDWLYHGKDPNYDFNESEAAKCRKLVEEAMTFGRRLLQNNVNERDAFKMMGDTLMKDLRCYFTSGTDALAALDDKLDKQQENVLPFEKTTETSS